MKKIIVYALAAFTLAACDIDRFPYNYYTKDDVYSDAEIMLTGCYSQLKLWADNMHFLGEYGGDNISKQATSTDPWFEYISYNHTPTNSRITNFWNHSYKLISQASDFIDLGEAGEFGQADQMIGEAYFLRGMMYFYLVRTFGRPYYQEPDKNLGVPIVNGLPDDVFNVDLPDRATVKETYEQIISDLKKAESLMEPGRRSIYGSKEVAQALLSRVYLYMSGTYENPNLEYADLAIEYADKVIGGNNFELLSRANFMKYNELSPESNSQTETIFAVKKVTSDYTISELRGNIGGMYSTIDGIGWGEVYASATYLDLIYESKGNDARGEFIRPNYKSNDDAFRFVSDRYNTDGEHTGYTYVQGLTEVKNGTLYVKIDEDEYPLTLVDEEIQSYSINYGGKEYIGYADKEIGVFNGYLQFYVYKCSYQDGETQLHSPIVVRLAEMYLNKAEAYVKKGDYARALTALNTVRERAIPDGGYTSLDASNAKERVNKERRLEFGFEAHRAVDIFRLGETLTRRYPGVQDQLREIPATDNRVVKYIPQDDINAYPGPLTQNP